MANDAVEPLGQDRKIVAEKDHTIGPKRASVLRFRKFSSRKRAVHLMSGSIRTRRAKK